MKMFPQFRSKVDKGYTLIELLVVIAIVALVTGGAIAGYVQFSKRQEVLMYAKEVQQIFRLAKSKAQVHETPTVCSTADSPLTAYRIIVSSSQITMKPICSPTSTTTSDFPSVSIPASSNISITSGTGSYDYHTLEGGFFDTSGNALSSDRTIRLTNGTTTYQFTITPGGAISGVDEP